MLHIAKQTKTDTLHQKQCLISPFTLVYQYNAHLWCLKYYR